NETMRHNLDWSMVDIEHLAPDAVPVTSYKPRGDRYEYDVAYTDWGTEEKPRPARDYYRVAWRAMAANTGERTLIPALMPPGAAHITAVFSARITDGGMSRLIEVTGVATSLLADFMVRCAPKSGIYWSVFQRLPFESSSPVAAWLSLRTLRLNCITDAYAELWNAAYQPQFAQDSWTSPRNVGLALGAVADAWTPDVVLRRAADRRQALVE